MISLSSTSVVASSAQEPLPPWIVPYLDGHLAERYPDEDYVYLARERTIVIHQDGSYDITYYQAAQVLTFKGVEDKKKIWNYMNGLYATFSFDFARTINGAEEIVSTDESDVIDQFHRNYFIKDRYHRRRCTIPFSDLRIGSIIEYRYTVSYSAEYREGACWFDFPIQYKFPVLRARVTFRVPKGMKLNTKLRGDIPVQETRRIGDETVEVRFVADDVPALTDEVNAPKHKERAARVMASTFDTWEDFARWFMPSMEEACTVTDEQWEAFREDLKYTLLYQGDLMAIYKYVSGFVNLNSLGLWKMGSHIPAASAVIDFGGENIGGAALMIAMFRRSGIEAYPALMSRRTLEIEAEIVCPGQFDRMLVHVPGRGYLDPMLDDRYRDDLPPYLLEKPVTILRLDGVEVSSTPPIGFPGSWTLSSKINIETDGSIVVDEKNTYMENYSADMREKIMRIPGGGKIKRPEVREYLEKNFTRGDILDWNYHDISALHGPFYVDIKYRSRVHTSRVGDRLLVKLPIRHSALCKNLLGEFKERTTPVDLEPLSYKYNCVIRGTSGHRLKALPEPVEMENEVGSFRTKFTTSRKGIACQAEFTIKKRRIPLEEYPELRSLLEAHYAALQRQIVFECWR